MPKGGKKGGGGHGGHHGNQGAQFSASDEAKLEALVAKYEETGESTATTTAGGKATETKKAPQQQQFKSKTEGTASANQSESMADVFKAKAELQAAEGRKERESAHLERVARILQAKGESGVQEALRLEIIKTKKIESEIAQASKKVANQAREHDQTATEYAKCERARQIAEAHCTTLVSENKRMQGETEKRVEEDKANRDSIREKITGEMKRLEGKLEDEDAQHEKTVAENLELRAKFDELKGKFDDQFAKYEEDWKMRETQTKLLIQKTQLQVNQTDQAQAEYLSNEKQLTQYIEGTQGLKQQYDLFSEKLGEFENAAVQQEDVAGITAKQMDTLKERLAHAEKTKNDALETKRKLDHLTTQLRQKAKGMKTKVQAAERTKVQAESKCRDAQSKAQAAKDKENVAAGGGK